MTSIHAVYIYDQNGTLQTIFEGWRTLHYVQRTNQFWNSEITAYLPYEDDRTEFIRNSLKKDWIFEVYRYDLITGNTNLVYEGLHQTTVDQVVSTGVVLFNLYSQGYTKLLDRRIVVPDPGDDASVKSGVAETIMREYVDEQAINPLDANRVITGLTNEVNQGYGANAAYTARYTKLSTVVSNIADQGGLSFGVVKGDSVGEFKFRVKELWGTDKRLGNTLGNSPVVFDLFHGNMEIPILSENASEERNYFYVGGQGDGSARVIEELQDATAIAASRWGRKEDFVDGRQEADVAGLQTLGQARLEETKVRKRLTFNTKQTASSRWIRDWELGDIVTARYFDNVFTKKIIEVDVTVTSGDDSQIEVITPELKDV